MNYLKGASYLCLCLFLCCASYAVVDIAGRIDQTGRSISESVATVSASAAAAQVNVRAASDQLTSVADTIHAVSITLDAAIRRQSDDLNSTALQANTLLTSATASTNQLTNMLKQAQASTAQIGATAEQIRLDALPTFTSIQKASADVPGLVSDTRTAIARTVPTMDAVQRTSAAIAIETPATAAAVRSVAVDVQKVTDNFVKRKSWWKRVFGM